MDLNQLFQIDEIFESNNNSEKANNTNNKCKGISSSLPSIQATKKQKISHVKCSCQFHSEAKKAKNSFKVSERQCNVCKVFIFCSDCYEAYLEILYSHEEDCKRFWKKFHKRKEQS